MPDVVSEKEKSDWFRELLEIQQGICERQNNEMIGKTIRVLIDSIGKSGDGYLAGRTEGNIIVETEGDRSLIGSFVDIKIDKAMNWAVSGSIV